MSTFTAADIEQKIFELEEIKIVFRCAKNTTFTTDYTYTNKAANTANLTSWLETRVSPITKGICEVVVIDGTGVSPHGRTQLQKIRESYNVN